jgi:CRP-like cAMP-binding protein
MALRDAAWLARCVGRGELAPFSAGDVDALARAIGIREVEAGTPLMTEADPITSIGLIHHGEVELTRRTGLRRVVLQVLHPGDLYGDIPFLCHMASPFGARALTVLA